MTDSLDQLFETFVQPPNGYGEVAFYWWLGDPLTRERITWQLDQLADAHISGLQVNYAHSDQGGLSWGLTYPSEPELFSEAWWELFGWFLGEAEKRGIAVSLSDYTLGGPGQGSFLDEVIAAYPQLRGSKLAFKQWTLGPGRRVPEKLDDDLLTLTAFRTSGDQIDPSSALRLESHIQPDGRCTWSATSGEWRVLAVHRKRIAASLDPMSPLAGTRICEAFFGNFVERFPHAAGKGLNFFFSDELHFGVSGFLWNDQFAAEFIARKGYDITSELPALFVDIGPRTPKIRVDYHDVMVSLSEENYFRPVYKWHESRGMTYGCDHGGRGREVKEFGDYFRTQRWNQGPGCDQPRLESDVVKNKVASSISHLYGRPRTWLEGFYASGWGTTPGQVIDAAWRNFAMGHNLLTLHGLYYSTHGGWWEWAPPCNHFRMPYWKHFKTFLRGSERLSYLLSQGVHRCDVAVMYPVEPVQAAGDERAASTAFECATALYDHNIDLDFIDAQSLERANTSNGHLNVAGEQFKALILPAMNVLRHASLIKTVEFARGGGRVYIVGCWPDATDRAGRGDSEVSKLVKELREHAIFIDSPKVLPRRIRDDGIIDFNVEAPGLKAYHLHRRVGGQDIYFVYGVPRGTRCFFRAAGRVEFWDAMNGSRRTVYEAESAPCGTILLFPGEAHQACVLVFTNEPATQASRLINIAEVISVDTGSGEVTAMSKAGGRCEAVINHGGKPQSVVGSSVEPPAAIMLDELWGFELLPTMDNRWGDYRLPETDGLIGAEIRQLRCSGRVCEPSDSLPTDVSSWQIHTLGFGPVFWQSGPFSSVEADHHEAGFVALRQPSVNGAGPAWRTYDMSWRFGVEDDPGRQGYHGLKGLVTDEFLAVGRRKPCEQSSPAIDYEVDPSAPCSFFWTAFHLEAPAQVRLEHGGLRPTRVWLNHATVELNQPIDLPAGIHRVLLRYEAAGRNFVVVRKVGSAEVESGERHPLSMSWFKQADIVPFDLEPSLSQRTEWYYCTLPPGFIGLQAKLLGTAEFWHAGQKVPHHVDHLAGACVVNFDEPVAKASELMIRIDQACGNYGGAAFAESITVKCAKGQIALGDWSAIDALSCYSGGARYSTEFTIQAADERTRTWLDLGDVVASAEVLLNGKSVGVRLSMPWSFDVTQFVRPGTNKIEVEVFNTLANHYKTIPTRYRGDGRSGLIGPVTIRFESIVALRTAH